DRHCRLTLWHNQQSDCLPVSRESTSPGRPGEAQASAGQRDKIYSERMFLYQPFATPIRGVETPVVSMRPIHRNTSVPIAALSNKPSAWLQTLHHAPDRRLLLAGEPEQRQSRADHIERIGASASTQSLRMLCRRTSRFERWIRSK